MDTLVSNPTQAEVDEFRQFADREGFSSALALGDLDAVMRALVERGKWGVLTIAMIAQVAPVTEATMTLAFRFMCLGFKLGRVFESRRIFNGITAE